VTFMCLCFTVQSMVKLDEEVLKDIFDIKERSYSDNIPADYGEADYDVSEIFQIEENCDHKHGSHGFKCVNYMDCDDEGYIIEDFSSILEARHAVGESKRIEVSGHTLAQSNWKCGNSLDTCCKDSKHVPCPSKDWTWHNNTCYTSKPPPYGAFTFKQAAQACRSIHENATLPEASTLAEEEFIESMNVSQPFWMGASRKFRADYRNISSWKWQDGRPLSLAFWDEGQPNNGGWWVPVGERCIRMFNNRWDDHRCWHNNAVGLLCQLSVE